MKIETLRPGTPTQPLVHESRIKIPYAWSAGETGSYFLIQLRDHKKFFASKCPECKKVYFLPKKTCGECFAACGEWVEVGPGAVLLEFTQANYKSAAHPVEKPIYGLIKLDGASTAFLHLLGETSLTALKPAARLTAVFKEERQGSILDIAYFKVVNE